MISEKATKYFANINFMCKKIMSDVKSIETQFGDLWEQLSYENKCNVIDKALIYKDHILKYLPDANKKDKLNYFNSTLGDKIIYEEDRQCHQIISWRDEFSAPFTWQTKSQTQLANRISVSPELFKNIHCEKTNSDMFEKIIPQTGYDFLDNW